MVSMILHMLHILTKQKALLDRMIFFAANIGAGGKIEYELFAMMHYQSSEKRKLYVTYRQVAHRSGINARLCMGGSRYQSLIKL